MQVWYPAAGSDGAAGLIGQNALFIGTWKSDGATPQSGALPLVLFSHGSGGNAERLGWFATALAEAGFVVAAPNHTGTTAGDSDPFQTPMVWNRTADLTAALDLMLDHPPAGLTIDPARITAAGFSLGGHSALALGGARLSKSAFIDYCDRAKGQLDCGWMQSAGVDFQTIDQTRYEADLSDPRITSVIAIDPALTPAMTPDSLSKLAHPTLVLNLGAPETLPIGLDAKAAVAQITQARYATITGAKHFSFLSECSLLGQVIIGFAGEDNICSDQGLRPRQQVHTEILDAVLSFLRGTNP